MNVIIRANRPILFGRLNKEGYEGRGVYHACEKWEMRAKFRLKIRLVATEAWSASEEFISVVENVLRAVDVRGSSRDVFADVSELLSDLDGKWNNFNSYVTLSSVTVQRLLVTLANTRFNIRQVYFLSTECVFWLYSYLRINSCYSRCFRKIAKSDY